MITIHQLSMLMDRLYPEKTHGVDFAIGAPVNPDNPMQQAGDATVTYWTGPEPKPNVKALLGLYGSEIDAAHAKVMGRFQRNKLLGESDKLVAIPDSDIQKRYQADLEKYRQALRDVPAQKEFPTNINWPRLPKKPC